MGTAFIQAKSKSRLTFGFSLGEEEAGISVGATVDLDIRELTNEGFRNLRPVGRLKEDVVKERVAIRLSPDVVVEFITMGEWLADPN